MTLCDALDGVRALLVEDDPLVSEALRLYFAACGIRTTEARSADEALDCLDRHAFDIIVSDIVMPGSDGIALMREVRRRPTDRGGRVPAIALSADADPARRAEALEAGFHAYLVKPLRPPYIIAVMTAVLLGEGRAPAGPVTPDAHRRPFDARVPERPCERRPPVVRGGLSTGRRARRPGE